MWGLFGFSAGAGLVFLTLLPAVRRGSDYVRANGSPWSWPLYPWALFSILAFAVPGRAFLLCWSLHLLDGADRDGARACKVAVDEHAASAALAEAAAEFWSVHAKTVAQYIEQGLRRVPRVHSCG